MVDLEIESTFTSISLLDLNLDVFKPSYTTHLNFLHSRLSGVAGFHFILTTKCQFSGNTILGIGFSSLSSAFPQRVDFVTKCLRKTVHSVVEIYGFLLVGPEEAGKNLFFIKYNYTKHCLLLFI